MKPFENLTYLSRIYRFRQLARAALQAYGLHDARFELLMDAGNTLFRVYASPSGPVGAPPQGRPPAPPAARASELFEDGQYLLRIHQPDYQTAEAIQLELAWLSMLRRDGDLPVPEPLPALDGRLLAQICSPGIPGPRNCSLLRWVKGRRLADGAQPRHYRAQGQALAQMHALTAAWQPPPGSHKRNYDWEGLFLNDPEIGLQPGECWRLLPPELAAPCESVAAQTRAVMEAWGKGAQVYGLIHADCGVDANVLFWRGQPRLIDFDGSGYGYWVYELAVALEHCRDHPAYLRLRQALLDGYTAIRPLPAAQLAQLELFMAAFHIYYALWCAGAIQRYPDCAAELRPRLERAGRLVARHAAGIDH